MKSRLQGGRPCRELALIVVALAIGLYPAWSVPAAESAAGGDEAGFTNLTGADGAHQWLAYGIDQSGSDWPKSWSLEGDVLHCSGGGSDLMTREKYGELDLRFDWKISAGGNSGMMYRVAAATDPAYFSGPEYQVVDNAGQEDGKNTLTAAASLYALYPAEHDVTKPAGEWNSARIVIRGNRVQHYLNGQLIVDAVINGDDWNARVASSKFAEWKGFGKSPTGHVVLQDHGNEVWFRNVRIKPLEGSK